MRIPDSWKLQRGSGCVSGLQIGLVPGTGPGREVSLHSSSLTESKRGRIILLLTGEEGLSLMKTSPH
ncbi:hypothetical protein JZ751_008887 [Albula glossodonta]|uniref:Uncharacterized protein n=1 Tax=Albula glossodonta TaxID=121402 RepID=A0A8T2NXH1_9TELE|nr:hypothetical protein JZ751_008887 [Albula glossodonta]